MENDLKSEIFFTSSAAFVGNSRVACVFPRQTSADDKNSSFFNDIEHNVPAVLGDFWPKLIYLALYHVCQRITCWRNRFSSSWKRSFEAEDYNVVKGFGFGMLQKVFQCEGIHFVLYVTISWRKKLLLGKILVNLLKSRTGLWPNVLDPISMKEEVAKEKSYQ